MTNGKPVVCMKLPNTPLPICTICGNEMEEFDAMYFDGDGMNGRKRWKHVKCYKAQEREALAHDRVSSTPVPTICVPPASQPLVAGSAGADMEQLLDELAGLGQQLYDIEAHVGSALAGLRVIQALVKK